MDKQTIIHTYNEILFSLKQILVHAITWKNPEDILSELSLSLKVKYCVSTLVRFIRKESKIVVVRGWEEGEMGSYCLPGREFQYGKMKKVLKMDGGDGCTNVNALNVTELYI